MKYLLVLSVLLHAAGSLVAHPASGLAVDGQGRVFFAAGPMIVMIETNGALTGSGRKGGNDGPRREATFDEPTGIAVAPNGDVFVFEPHSRRVRKISAGRVITFHNGLP